MASILDIFNRNRNKQVVKEERDYCDYNGLGFNILTNYSNDKAMRLSAINAGVNQISNSVALLKARVIRRDKDGEPINMINHPLVKVLNLKPDSRYTHFNFVKRMIECVILKGNAYALIIRDDDSLNVKELKYLEPDNVHPAPQPDGTVKYLVNGMNQAVDAIDMLHLYMHCDEFMNGIPVIKYAIMTLEGCWNAEKHSNNFFKSGANLSGVLQTTAPGSLDADKREQIRKIWTGAFRNHSDEVNVAVLPAGLEFKPISVDPETAQLLDSRKYGVIEIARFLNISPIKLFDLSQVSYSSMESTQLSYLQDTIMPYVRMLTDQINLKCFKHSEVGTYEVDFDFATLIQTNKKEEAEYYRSLITNGLMTINEARNKLGLPSVDEEMGGDELYLQMSYTTTKNIKSGALIKGQSQTQAVDNNLKSDNKTE